MHCHESNPGSKVQLIKYTSRPMLKITPPEGAKDRRILNFNYIEAVRNLPNVFSDEELEPILREIKSKWHGKVKSLFIVLSDDMIKKKSRVQKSAPVSNEANDEEVTESEGSPDKARSPDTAKSSKNSKGKGSKSFKRSAPSSGSSVSAKKQK